MRLIERDEIMALCAGVEQSGVRWTATACCSTRNRGRCDRDSGGAAVLMMQAANVWEGDDCSNGQLLALCQDLEV